MNLDLVRKSLSVTSHLLPEYTICKRGSILKGEQDIRSFLEQHYLRAGTHLLSAVVGKDIPTREMAGASETPMSPGHFYFLALEVPLQCLEIPAGFGEPQAYLSQGSSKTTQLVW